MVTALLRWRCIGLSESNSGPARTLYPEAATRPRLSQVRSRVLIVSHAYLEPEHRKTILALAEQVDVRVVSPRRLPEPRHLKGRFLKALDIDAGDLARERFLVYRALYRPWSPAVAQYALASLSLGLRRYRPNVIQVELPPWSPVFWQTVMARRLFAPQAALIVQLKKNTYRRHRGLAGRFKHAIGRLGLHRVDRIIASSSMVARLYEDEFAIDRERVAVMTHIGVDGELFAPRPGRAAREASPVVGFCGRLEPEKGLEELVEAVELCRDEIGIDVTLRVMGSGSLDRRLSRLAATRAWIELVEPIDGGRVHEFLQALDVFVLPARVLDDHEEHDAHALLEAMTVGIACIGTRSGIIPEVLDDCNGLVVDPGSPSALAAAIQRMLGDDGLRQQHARRGRASAQARFTLEPVTAAYVRLYRDLLADGRPG